MNEIKEPGMAFNMPTLHKIMAILSFIFFITTVWLFLDDYFRPWKAIQLEALKIKRQHLEKEIKLARGEIDSQKLSQLKMEFANAHKLVASRSKDIHKAENRLAEITKQIAGQSLINGSLNSELSAVNFLYEKALLAKDKEIIKRQLNKLLKARQKFFASDEKLKHYRIEEQKVRMELASLRNEIQSIQKEIKEITLKSRLLEEQKSFVRIDSIFALRNMPFFDFLDPTIKIHQIVINNVTEDRYFRQVPKVDRCITCHTFIDQIGYENEKNPFKTHPRLELMVADSSKHPMRQIGCTACHGGEGYRVNDFNSVTHTPENELQKKQWIKKYNWKDPHKINSPMFKLSQTEAGCVKCHSDVMLIKGASNLNEGRLAIVKNGCYACHKMEGWAENIKRPGPSLKKIAGKVNKDWLKLWIWEPRAFNKHARMPSYFQQTNNSNQNFQRYTRAEVSAMAEYIWISSSPYKPQEKYSAGDLETGKKLISEIGCLGCHGVDGLEENSFKIKATGSWLTGLGSKVSGDWLVSWLKKPNHYQEDTIMPSFRLTEREANDIATYLLSLKNKSFENVKFAKTESNARDELLIIYFSAFDTKDSAAKKVAHMSDQEKTLELGKRSISKYGCFSCHEIPGFDDLAPIGVELTKEGSKPIDQFSFGLERKIEHKRDAWFFYHLKNPRRWDQGLVKNFNDLYKMPNYYLSDEEAKKMTVALLGQVADVVPLAGVKKYSPAESLYNEAMKIAEKYNCTGCHQIDGLRGDILKAHEEDINQAPPRLIDQGHRVQSDWFYNYLKSPRDIIRPWLKVRMPTFNLSLEERNKLVAGFQQASRRLTFEEPKMELNWLPGERAGAIKLWNNLNCVTCHTIGFSKEPPLAPDLHLASRRLRPSWIKVWIKNPQIILPGSTMPMFFGEDGKTAIDTEVFSGDAEKQINALTKLIIEFGLY